MIEHPTQQLLPISALRIADYNPRQIEDEMMDALVESLLEFGFVEPIVARREDGLIIGGHQRLEAYKRLLTEQGGDPEEAQVPVIMLDGISDARAKALNLALNKISGEWDYEKLADILGELKATDLDLGVTGFSAKEMDDILALTSQSLAEASAGLDVDAELAKSRRRFVFEVETDEEMSTCQRALASYGMSRPSEAGKAFVAALTAALASKDEQ
jgi:ParB-like chromosome segregation protein Spo0J